MRIQLSFQNGLLDGRTVRTDSGIAEEAELARRYWLMLERGAIGEILAATDPRNFAGQHAHLYEIYERTEQPGELALKCRYRGTELLTARRTGASLF